MKAHPHRAQISGSTPAGAGIVSLLERLRRRVRNILLVRGIFLAVGVALIAVLAAVGVDALFAPDTPILRWGITLSVFLVTLAGAGIFLVRPVLQRVSIGEIARVLEVRHPELKERLSNALDIIRRRRAGDPNLGNYSEELLANTLRDAERSAQSIRPAREFVHHNWWKYGIVAATPVFAVCVLAMFFPDQLGRLLARVFDPTSEQGNVYASRMTITPGNAWVREGDPLIIVLETEHLDTGRAELVRRAVYGGGEVTREAMSLVEHDEQTGGSRFMIKFPAVTEGFGYQVNSGIGSSENFMINVRQWPELESMSAQLDFPEYTRLESELIKGSGNPFSGKPLTAPIGTKVRFEAIFSEPLKSAELQLPGGVVAASKIAQERLVAEFVMEPETNGDWHFLVRNEFDMDVETDPSKIRAVEDLPPMVRLFKPQYDRIVAKDDGKVVFGFETLDDFGVASCSLELMSNDGKRKSVDLDVAARVEHEFDLAQIVGEKSRRLIAFIRVRDTRPDEFGGAQVSDSRPIIIDIDHSDGPLRDPMENGEAEGLIERALAELKKAHAQADQMSSGIRQGDHMLANQELLDQLEAQIASADEALEALAEELDAQGQPSHSEKIRDISNSNVKPAGTTAQEIPKQTQAQDRVKSAESVEAELAEAIAKLDKMLLPSDLPPEFSESPLAQLASLAQEQKQLAFEAEEQAKESPNEPMSEEWMRKQLELAHAMKQALVKKQGGPP